MVLVTGDFGTGKTALVRAVTSQLATSSYRVLYLAAMEGSNSLRPVVEGLLDQLGEKIPFNNVARSMAWASPFFTPRARPSKVGRTRPHRVGVNS